MADPLSLIALGAAVGGAAGKFTEKAWDSGERWLKQYFRDHAPRARESARMNSARFLLQLARAMSTLENEHQIGRDVIEAAQGEPQFSATLQRAILGASLTDDEGKHQLLAQLVARRLTVSAESTFSLAAKLACDAVANTNRDQLQLLALAVALHEVRPPSPLSSRAYGRWLTILMDPVLNPYIEGDIEYREIDVLHLVALGCVTYERGSGRDLGVVLAFKNGLVDGQLVTDHSPFTGTAAASALEFMWCEGLAGMNLTSVGSVIGGLVYDGLVGATIGPPNWARKRGGDAL